MQDYLNGFFTKLAIFKLVSVDLYKMDPGCSKAYSTDLRWRMVYQRCVLDLSYRQIANNLNVHMSTVRGTLNLFKETGTVKSIQGFHAITTNKLSFQDQCQIIEALCDNPSMYLHEMRHLIYLSSGTSVSIATVHNFLRKQGFSRHKLSFRAQQRKDWQRSLFLSEISLLEGDMFVFIDESGTDKLLSLRRYGYRGTRAVSEKRLVRGRRLSSIAAICIDGVIDVDITPETVNGDRFCRLFC